MSGAQRICLDLPGRRKLSISSRLRCRAGVDLVLCRA